MKIEIKKFGKMLISRPAGKEAFAAAKAYVLSTADSRELALDFAGVDVLSPSWADEFISGLKGLYPSATISYLNTDNQSVKATLAILKKNN
ncbi:MAG: DUF4325 domain-containing protein [bacterium]|nr:STAS-like domain-containing protein [Candidatus Margulisiibacteriota bacterium]